MKHKEMTSLFASDKTLFRDTEEIQAFIVGASHLSDSGKQFFLY